MDAGVGIGVGVGAGAGAASEGVVSMGTDGTIAMAVGVGSPRVSGPDAATNGAGAAAEEEGDVCVVATEPKKLRPVKSPRCCIHHSAAATLTSTTPSAIHRVNRCRPLAGAVVQAGTPTKGWVPLTETPAALDETPTSKATVERPCRLSRSRSILLITLTSHLRAAHPRAGFAALRQTTLQAGRA